VVALHTYLVDDAGKIFARMTAYADDEDEAGKIMEGLDAIEADDSFEIFEEPVDAPDAAALRQVSDAQDDEELEDEDLEADELDPEDQEEEDE
jgi:hypothetical protein